MFLDEIDKIVENMDTNFKIGYLAEKWMIDIAKKMGITPIYNWFVASYGTDASFTIAINVRYKGEKESLFTRDIFLSNNIPVLGFEYDFDRNEFDIYEEKKDKYIQITKDTMVDKYPSIKRNKNQYSGQVRYKEIDILDSKEYASFIKSLDTSEVKDFYIVRNNQINELLFGHFQRIIDLDFCYENKSTLVVVDVKNKTLNENDRKFIINRGESLYYQKLLNFNKIKVQVLAIVHQRETNENKKFLESILKRKNNFYPQVYTKKITNEWLSTGLLDRIQDQDVLTFDIDDLKKYNLEGYFDNLYKKEIINKIESLPLNISRVKAYIFFDLFKKQNFKLFNKEEFKNETIKSIEQLKIRNRQIVTLKEKKILFVAQYYNNESKDKWNVMIKGADKEKLDIGEIDVIIFYKVNKILFDQKQFLNCYEILGYTNKDHVCLFNFLGREYKVCQSNLTKVEKGLILELEKAEVERDDDLYFLNIKNGRYSLRMDLNLILN